MDVTEADGLESERARLAEAERQQRILSDVSRALLDYVGPDEDEPLRRIVAKVADATGDWCSFTLVQPDGVMRTAAAHHPDPRQRELVETLNKVLPPGRWDAGIPGTNALVEKRPLRELGYAVDEARDGVTTLARGARPDVMLIDLMMPVMDGWTLIARLREEQVASRVPLVVFSADRDAREKASMLSADAALRKPFALEELQEVLDRLLRRQPAA
jgi:CheY-like chemotaxis protein